MSLADAGGESNRLHGTVEEVSFLGSVVRIRVRFGENAVSLDTFNKPSVPPPDRGTKVTVSFARDALLLLVSPAGPACHTGERTCWGDDAGPLLVRLARGALPPTFHALLYIVALDPEDGCTFWIAGEYIAATGSFNWRTRIGSFTQSNCAGINLTPRASIAESDAT